MSVNRLNMEGILLFEHPFARVPYENLRKTFRSSQKHIERELGLVVEAAKKEDEREYDALRTLNAVEGMIARVEGLKAKLSALHSSSTEPGVRALRERLEHIAVLDECTTRTEPAFDAWAATRLDRWLVDWALRTGRFNTAREIATSRGIEPLCDIELFADIRRVEDALARHSCAEALAWCAENKIALRKAKSSLEFELRLQEYIELCRASRLHEAIAYGRKHLRPWQETHGERIQRASVLPSFPPTTTCKPLKKLYDASRWETLASAFRAAVYELHSLPSQPLLSYALHAGLSALKVPACSEGHESMNVDCPVCDTQALGGLANEVPSSHQVISSIVCRISGKVMEGDNGPLAFPESGNVYSREALEEMASRNGGYVTCPRSGETVALDQLRKVFIS